MGIWVDTIVGVMISIGMLMISIHLRDLAHKKYERLGEKKMLVIGFISFGVPIVFLAFLAPLIPILVLLGVLWCC